MRRVLELADRQESEALTLVEGDVRSAADLDRVFGAATGVVDGVIHFAGLKAVGESVADPLRYWDVNLSGSRCLADAMERHGCRTLVFSSTSTVYGEPEHVPTERGHADRSRASLRADEARRGNDAAGTLAMISPWRIASLRYFNPVGAHPSGHIGEDPLGVPNNLFPFITQVAAGRRETLQIFGQDYPTPDGTGIRDYLHVMDLAEAHSSTLRHLLEQPTPPISPSTSEQAEACPFWRWSTALKPRPASPSHGGSWNVAPAMCRASRLVLRRQQLLGWQASRTLDDMCRDGWAWQRANPRGYRSGS